MGERKYHRVVLPHYISMEGVLVRDLVVDLLSMLNNELLTENICHNLWVDVTRDCDGFSSLQYYYDRPETDEEMAAREALQEEADTREFARLAYKLKNKLPDILPSSLLDEFLSKYDIP